ncbi:DUF4105 domain-containing protein [Stenotrophomonas aracearum]|uniref:DUF4105 domain-containing protein n=1 Tax=Stenotrophomonas aracearum TaxID=3003272 RepID=A0ABY9YHF1_9GAMM|nr:DUF4105 domain-containing protein [Stenotrophomonas sp. A5588]WNH50293.1 DUF4105 domain-containing protein [Stenotrophomonas sp. A5588]
MFLRRRALRRCAAVLAVLLSVPTAHAALQLQLQADGLTAVQAASAAQVLRDAPALLPASWQARFVAPVTVAWSDRLPDNVHGRTRQGAITLRRDLLDAVRPGEPLPRAVQAALIHELTHVLDRAADGGWSSSARWRDLAGWQQRPWRLGRGANAFTERSPDPYERHSPAEYLAVNAEHYLLDADFACRRPALAAWYAAGIGAGPQAGCAGTVPLVQAGDTTGEASLLELDPRRVYAVDYLLAEGNDQLMSRWGHSMLRLVICAPGRPRGPACRLDLAEHRVLSFRAFVGDVQISSWSGLTGAYPSRLFVLPLNQVINEYTQLELRGLQSVPLALEQDDIASLLERVGQVHWSYDGRYRFISNNCAVETGKLLQEGVPRWADPGLNRLSPGGLLRRLEREGRADATVLDDRREAMRLGYYFPSAQVHYQQLFDVARAELNLPTRNVSSWLQLPAEQRAAWAERGGLRATSALLLLEQAARYREELRARDGLKRALGAAGEGGDSALAALLALLDDAGQLVNPAGLVGGEGYGLPVGEERTAAAAATQRISARGVPAWTQLQAQMRARLPVAQQRELLTIDDTLATLGDRMRRLAREG